MPIADDVLLEGVDTLGRLPQRWWEKWEYRWESCKEDGTKKIEDLSDPYRVERPLVVRVSRMTSKPPVAREAEQLSDEDLAGL